MPMTLTEKILAAHAGLPQVSPGQEIVVDLDRLVCSEISGSLAIDEFRKSGFKRVLHPERLALIPDHFIPARDVHSATQMKQLRDFALEQGVDCYYEVGRGGIEHCVVLEEGLALPGQMLIGSDSHCCSYGAVGAVAIGCGSSDAVGAMISGQCWLRVPKTIRIRCVGKPKNPWIDGKDAALFLIKHFGLDGADSYALEFSGKGLSSMPMHWRITIANMLTECGAENSIFPADEITAEYLSGRTTAPWQPALPDEDAEYADELTLDLSALEPMVALPPSPANVIPVREAADLTIHQVFIGSCTSGSLEDLRTAADVLKGKTIHSSVRVIVLPGTQSVYLQAIERGYIQDLTAAGAMVGPSSCGPCFGGHLGLLADGERCVSTSNRNFPGRMGHLNSEVYLTNVAVAAASAVSGYVSLPEVMV